MRREHDSEMQPSPLEIQEPCPKTWAGLVGGEGQRYCDQCELHVHDGAALTRAEAVELVESSAERVCMRIVQDPTGAPVFRDSPKRVRASASPAEAPVHGPPSRSRLSRWASALVAGLLAIFHSACQPDGASSSDTSGGDPGTNGGGTGDGSTCSTDVVGAVAVPPPELLGDVALTPHLEPEEPVELMGKPSVQDPQGSECEQPPEAAEQGEKLGRIAPPEAAAGDGLDAQ